MKLTIAKIQECASWVESNGLYPQPCGASIKQFCEAMGISDKTYSRWMEKSEVSDAITRAREVFRQTSVREVSNALIKAAKGVDFTKKKEKGRAQVVKEYDPVTGKKTKEYTTDTIVTVESYRETVYFPPDVNAAKFVLKNLDPENWKEKQDSDVSLSLNSEEPPVIVFGTQEDPQKEE